MKARLKKLYSDSGLLLFLLRLPARAFKKFKDTINTKYYSIFLGSFGGGVIEWGVRIENPKNVFIGNNVYIARHTKFVSENSNGILKIGDSVQIGIGCHIDHTGNVSIGSFCHLSEQSVLYSHSHGYDPRSIPQPFPKVIEDKCWIGLRAVILESADFIAAQTIIASCALVSKPIQIPKSIFGGVPARLIKVRDE